MSSSRPRLALLPLFVLAGLAAGGCSSPGGRQLTLAPQCTNGVQDPNEGGLDCGGPCPVCALAACGNGQRDPSESDTDCGGPCAGCVEGRACTIPGDCLSGNCVAGYCASPAACDDGEHNGDETDLDCGGGCGGCGAGRACADAADCLSDVCADGVCGEPASCQDGQKSPDESDVDCGGPCRACATGRYCDGDLDCLSVVCVNGVCRDPSCSDDRRNQDESDVDCGGACPSCDDGARCGDEGDCRSGACAGGRCVSCEDGLDNGDETGVDCGGSCDPCQDGGPCEGDGDCATGKCDRGFCCEPNACGECAALPIEVCDGGDNDCDGATDEAAELGVGPACDKDEGVCVGARASCRGASGWTCELADYRRQSSKYEVDEATCDGLDNDCDGQTDEGVKNLCGTCGVAPAEVCDTLDNDCDGQTDEGVANACGRCGPVPDELCNRRDDDCDGQTDELAACDACMTEGVELAARSDGAGLYVTGGAVALLPDETPIVVVPTVSGFDLVELRQAPVEFAPSFSGTSALVARVGSEILVAHQSGSWTMRRFNASGAVLETLASFLPMSSTIKTLVGSGSEALLVASELDFRDDDNDWKFSERRLSAGAWSASAVFGNGAFEAAGVLAGQDPVRLFFFATEDGTELRASWGASAPQTLTATWASSVHAATAPDGKVHVAFDIPLQHWVGTSAPGGASWSRSALQGEQILTSVSGLAFYPTGEPVVLLVDQSAARVGVLRNNRWNLTTLVQAAAGERFDYGGALALDRYGRVHVVFSGSTDGASYESWVRGVTACPSL